MFCINQLRLAAAQFALKRTRHTPNAFTKEHLEMYFTAVRIGPWHGASAVDPWEDMPRLRRLTAAPQSYLLVSQHRVMMPAHYPRHTRSGIFGLYLT